MKLVAITVYPVKSCRGIALTRARVERRGLANDRRWMVVDDAGRFVTQREEARLALVDVGIEDEAITMSVDRSCVAMPIAIEDGIRIEVDVWGRRVLAIAHDEASRWMSAHLARNVRVVHLPASSEAPSASPFARPGDEVSFADGYPLLAATEESLADLGARIEARGVARVPMERFRPNVVLRGAAAWDEDAWGTIAIGALTLRAPKACDRCVITTIDPSTARAGPEPLRTLATFRRRDHGVWFGVNLVPDSFGEITIGDAAEVTERIPPPRFEHAASA